MHDFQAEQRTDRRGFLKLGLGGAALLGASPLLTACGGSGAAVASLPSRPSVDTAREEGAVSLYTSLDSAIVDQIIAPFKAKYDIDVEYFRGGSVDVTNKVLAEATAGQTRADVIDASDVTGLLVMKGKKILRPYRSPAAEAIPRRLRDPQDYWVADRLTQGVIQYSTKALRGADVPRRWQDLADPRFRGNLAFFSAPNGDGAPRLYTLAQHFGWDLLESYAANRPLRVSTPQLVSQTLERGEREVGFANNDNLAWRSERNGEPTDYVYPDEGVPTELGAVALTAQPPHPHAAMLFYDWWLSKAGQRILTKAGKYSSRTDVPGPPGGPRIGNVKLLVLDYHAYQAKRAEILKRMTQIFGGEWGA